MLFKTAKCGEIITPATRLFNCSNHLRNIETKFEHNTWQTLDIFTIYYYIIWSKSAKRIVLRGNNNPQALLLNCNWSVGDNLNV